ncbi:hypothetical protein CNR22_19190 [Sphingobacteriaceae bacterium]|nr:hypothetical protein CNR22_19190 [Sphingobacteriaceae bacterium]
MSRSLIVFSLLIALLIGVFIYYKNAYFPKYNWTPDYKINSEQPYGLKLAYTTIKNNHSTTIIYNQSYHLLDTNSSNSNLVFIGDDFYIDSVAASSLIKYVEKGNNVLISSNYSPLEILRNFIPLHDTIYGFGGRMDSLISLDFRGDSVPFKKKIDFHYQYLKDTASTYWSYYGSNYYKDTLSTYDFEPISFLNDSNLNAFYVRCGKGKFILHANPVLFTNYYMVGQNGFEHANNMLSKLHKGPVYWDDHTSVQSNSSRSAHVNPLKFLFSHPHLKWAWYLFLITIVLYLVFRSKREQRIIPLMPVNTNASVEYTKAIGTLYFQSKGHTHIANEMYILFLSEIRTRYNLSTDMAELDLVELLSIRSGIDKSVLYNLFKQFKFIRSSEDASADDLINLHNAIENYNKKRK